MVYLRIPNEHYPVLRAISALPQEQFAELLSALETVPVSLSVTKLPVHVAAKALSIAAEEIDGILAVLLALRRILVTEKLTTAELVSNIRETLASEESSEMSGTELERLLSRLTQLLEVKTFAHWVKAFELLHENERSFREARVITDIRPVFSDTTNSSLQASFVIHTLKISFWEDNRRKNFFLALDNSDLQTLIDQLSRAQNKAETIKSYLSSTNLHAYESGD
jgi:hypothetical protein